MFYTSHWQNELCSCCTYRGWFLPEAVTDHPVPPLIFIITIRLDWSSPNAFIFCDTCISVILIRRIVTFTNTNEGKHDKTPVWYLRINYLEYGIEQCKQMEKKKINYLMMFGLAPVAPTLHNAMYEIRRDECNQSSISHTWLQVWVQYCTHQIDFSRDPRPVISLTRLAISDTLSPGVRYTYA